MKQLQSFILICVLCLSLTACGDVPEQADDGKLTIVTTIFPEYDWLRNLTAGSENVEVQLLIDKGQKLKDGLLETAKKYDYDLHVTGMPSLFYLRIADDPTLMLHQEWVAECVKRGIFITNHHNHFINASLSDEDIKETIEIADEAFAIIKDRHS